jgi:hypothetical protein
MKSNKMQLIAMAPSGSAYIVRRELDNALWLVHPEGSEESESISEGELATALAFHNFVSAAAPYESPEEVEKRINDSADAAELEEVRTTVDDVRRFLRTLAQDATDLVLALEVLAETGL